MNISEISKRTSLAKTTLTSMLDRMESGGLIQRLPDPENRRQITIVLTPKARTLNESYERISEEMNQVFYSGFSQAEIDGFEAALQHIIINLEKKV
ncbi:MAG TPA: MarR family transcriptional regulator [Clostridia bacterium]